MSVSNCILVSDSSMTDHLEEPPCLMGLRLGYPIYYHSCSFSMTVSGGWNKYSGYNCLGSTDIGEITLTPFQTDLCSCKGACSANKDCKGIIFNTALNNCYLRKNIDLSRCTYGQYQPYEVYLSTGI